MKKLALALVASSFVAGTASADISTGFYLGAGIGGNSTSSNVSIPNVGGVAGANASANLGRHNIDGTIFGGYGFVTGCTYLGGELGFTFTGGKANASVDATVAGGTLTTVTAERRNVIKAAFLVGQKFTPSTMAFIRLGMNNADIRINGDKKRKFSFAPGVGVRTAVTKNVELTFQYEYDLGAKHRDVKVKTQAATLGVAYKF